MYVCMYVDDTYVRTFWQMFYLIVHFKHYSNTCTKSAAQQGGFLAGKLTGLNFKASNMDREERLRRRNERERARRANETAEQRELHMSRRRLRDRARREAMRVEQRQDQLMQRRMDEARLQQQCERRAEARLQQMASRQQERQSSGGSEESYS